MEYRKLIKFGKNSFIISLPKQWVEHNKLKKGSTVHVQPNGHQLTLMARPDVPNDELSEIVIDLDKVPVSSLQRIITSAYINNVRAMHITGKKLPEQASHVRSIIHNLMALEIIEQNTTKIVARDYLNMSEISIENLLRKCDNIIRSMFLDILKAAKNTTPRDDVGSELGTRDLDVNRLTFLALRAVKFQIANPMLVEPEYSSEDLVHVWEVAQNIERIADELKYVARFLDKVADGQDISLILAELNSTYLAMMKAHYTRSVQDAILLGERRKGLMQIISGSVDGNTSSERIEMADHLRNLVRSVHNLNRMTYQRPEKI